MRALIVLFAVACVAACAALAGTREDGAAVELAHPRLVELSGLSWSADGRSLWGHNDYSHAAELFRFAPDGTDLGTVRVRGADNVDWEDLAHIDTGEGRLLLVGDTGDNLAQRDHYAIYAVPEPPPGAAEAEPLWTVRFRYADRARDAEGLAWDPREEALYLLGKRDTPPGLYRIAVEGDGVQTAEHVLDLELPPPPFSALFTNGRMALLYNLPTALDISSDGLRMAVLTYGALYVYDRAEDESWAEALARRAQTVRPPLLPQAEGLAMRPDGRRAVIGSEARPGLLADVALPARDQGSP